MRGTLGGAIARLLVAGLVAGIVTVSAGHRLATYAVGGLNTVTVSPTHGKTSAVFAVTYSVSPCTGAAGLTIGFSWNALPPAGQLLGTATTDSNCRATLSAAPPVDQATHGGPPPGIYQVFGYVALPTGMATPNTEASASYTIDVTPTPTPSPTHRATATARPTSHASASASSAPSTSASAAGGVTTSPSGTTASSQSGKPAAAVARRASGQQGWWTLGWVVLTGATLLALIVLALLTGWIIRRRARTGSGLRDNRAA
jgi:hypothetical protein